MVIPSACTDDMHIYYVKRVILTSVQSMKDNHCKGLLDYQFVSHLFMFNIQWALGGNLDLMRRGGC